MKKRWLILLAVLALVVTLFWRAPVEKVSELAGIPLPAGQWGGTLGQGWAQSLTVAGHRVEQLTWRLAPRALLRGAVASEVDLRAYAQQLQGEVGINWQRRVQARDARLLGPIDALPLNLPIVRLKGNLDAGIDALDLDRQGPISVAGTLRWLDAQLVGTVPVELGEVRIELSGADRELSATLSNQGGVLELGGDATLKDQQYRVAMRITPRGEIHPDIRQALDFIANVQGNGTYTLTYSGTLPSGLFNALP